MKNNIGSKKIISMVLITLLVLFTTKVCATNDSFSTTISTVTPQLKREDTITITIGLKDIAIESGEKGIGAYTASIKFDSSVLEYVSTDGTEKWEAPFYQNGLITGNTKDAEVVNTTQNIGTITFKVKKDAKLGETTIGLTNFSGSTAVSDVSASDKSIKIEIVDNSDNSSTNNNNDNNGGTNNNNNDSNTNNSNNNANSNNTQNSGSNSTSNNSGNNNSSNGGSNSNNKTNNVIDNSIKDGKLPKTGTADGVIFITIGAVTILGTIFFIKMRKF